MLAGLLLAAAVPCFAIAADSGAVAMLWHIGVAAMILCAVQWRRIAKWLKERAGLRSARAFGFVFASCFAIFSSPLAMDLNSTQPLPRFNDIFLVGVVLTAYLFTWEPAAFLLVISVLVSAWILPPYGTFRVEGFYEWYRLLSYTVVSIVIITLITRIKRPATSHYPTGIG